jgi:PAS domain S-box-containing protein
MCVSIDINNRICDCNIAFAETVGSQESEIVGKPLTDFFCENERSVLASFVRTLLNYQSNPGENIFHMLDAATGSISVRLRGACIKSGEDGPAAILVMQDITMSLEHEEKQMAARRQLYRSAHLVSIGTLASGVAHELNNPLAAVLGFADALLHRLEDHQPLDLAETEQYLGIIKKEALRCRDIIDNLLKFSRDREPQLCDISLNDCIQSAGMLLASKSAKKRIRIVNVSPDDVIIHADPQRIGQVFLHVLSNAIDFSPEGSTVEILKKRIMSGDRYVKVNIVDHGCGIAPGILPYIFDPFFTTKKVGQGLGIGLALSYKAMEDCEGVIDIISGNEKGTTVVLEIPLSSGLVSGQVV